MPGRKSIAGLIGGTIAAERRELMRHTTSSGLLLVCGLAACSGGSGPPPPDSCGSVPAASLYAAYLADPHYCMITFAQNVTGARQLAFAPNGDLFVGGGGQIVVLFDADGNGVSDADRAHDLRRGAGWRSRRRDHGVARLCVITHGRLPLAVRVRRSHRDRRDGTGGERDPGRRTSHPDVAHRRAEPPLRQRRQRRQRRRTRRPDHALTRAGGDSPVRPGRDARGRVFVRRR